MSIQRRVRHLRWHPPRNKPAARGILGGVLLMALGTGAGGVALELLPQHEDLGLVVAAGAVMFVIGLAVLLGTSLRELKNRPQAATGDHAYAWEEDYGWNRDRQRQDRAPLSFHWAHLASLLLGAIFEISATPLIYQHDRSLAFALGAIVGVFLLAGSLLWLRQQLRRTRYGECSVSFPQFPFFTGESMRLCFHAPRGLGTFRSLSFSLRYVCERVEEQTRGQQRVKVTLVEEHYVEERKLDTPGEHPDPLDNDIVFDIPDDVGETCMSDTPPSYWELQVKTQGGMVGLDATFLLPIYHNPESSVEAPQQLPRALETSLH